MHRKRHHVLFDASIALTLLKQLVSTIKINFNMTFHDRLFTINSRKMLHFSDLPGYGRPIGVCQILFAWGLITLASNHDNTIHQRSRIRAY